MFSLILLLCPHAAQAQSFFNVEGNAYRTTGSGPSTAFTGASIEQTNNAKDPTASGGVLFNTNFSNFGLSPGTPFGAVWTGSFRALYNGVYTFNITADDGFRLYLTNGGTNVAYFANWNESSATPRTYQVTLTANTTYAFRLEYYENGFGGGQISLGATAPSAPPSTTLSLTGYTFGGSVILNWNADPAATYYQIYRAVRGVPPYEPLGRSASPSYTDSSGTVGVIYDYYVRTYDSSGNYGPPSNPVEFLYAAPAVPTGLTATPTSNGISLTWTGVSGASSYNISRAVAGAGLAPYTSVGQSPFVDIGNVPNAPATTPGKTYYYQVTAVDRAGRLSGASNLAHADFPLTYTGSVDRADIGAISGWAKDLYNPATTLSVDLFDGASLLRSAVPAANARNDVGPHGFSVAPPAGLLDGKAHTLSIKYSGTNFDLPGSPRTFNPPAAASLHGYLDYVNPSAISGWAQDGSQPSASLNVEFTTAQRCLPAFLPLSPAPTSRREATAFLCPRRRACLTDGRTLSGRFLAAQAPI